MNIVARGREGSVVPNSSAGSMRSTDLWTSHVDAQTLIEIGQDRSGPCVSIFLPITGASDDSDAHAMSASITKARKLLGESSATARAVASVLHPAQSIVDAPQVWRSGSRGIAVFSSTAMFAVVLTGLQVSSQIVIARRFVTRQLLPALEDLTDFEVRSFLSGLTAVAANSRVLIDPALVIPAAHRGLISELYVERCFELWGCFDSTTSAVTRAAGMGPDFDDLIDLAAVKTLAHGGRVHVTDRLEVAGACIPMLAMLSREPRPRP